MEGDLGWFDVFIGVVVSLSGESSWCGLARSRVKLRPHGSVLAFVSTLLVDHLEISGSLGRMKPLGARLGGWCCSWCGGLA